MMAFARNFGSAHKWCGLLLSFAPGLLAAVFYGFISGSMSFVNKIVLTTFNYRYPDVLMFGQILMTSAVLEICRLLKLCDIPAWTLERARHFLVPSICFAIHTTLALAALGDLSIPMYNILRRLLPLANLLMARFLLKKTHSVMVMCSVLLVVAGCIVAGLGDVQFHLWAYINALTSVVAQSIYLTYVQKTGVDSDSSTLSVLHLNSINCIPFMLAYIIITGHINDAVHFQGNKDPMFVFIFVITLVLGCVLNYSLFLCATMNSALTTSLVGVIKSALTTIIGFFTFGGLPATVPTVVGISMNTFGGILYTYAKYSEKRRTLANQEDNQEDNQMLLTNEGQLNGVVVADVDDRTYA